MHLCIQFSPFRNIYIHLQVSNQMGARVVNLFAQVLALDFRTFRQPKTHPNPCNIYPRYSEHVSCRLDSINGLIFCSTEQPPKPQIKFRKPCYHSFHLRGRQRAKSKENCFETSSLQHLHRGVFSQIDG